MIFLGQAIMVMKPTHFPTIAGIGLVVTSAIAVVQSLAIPQENPFRRMNRAVCRQIGVILVALYAFAVMFEPGYFREGLCTTEKRFIMGLQSGSNV